MAFSLGKSAFLFVLAILLVVSSAEVIDKAVDIEDFDDVELNDIVRQEEGPPGTTGDPEDQTPARGPQANFIPPPSRVCGVFILCERQGGFFGAPSAALIQGSTGRFFVKTVGDCKSFTVRGKCKGKTKRNHALLWPVNGEEFDELCFYIEQKHACRTGTVQVIKRVGGVDSVEYSCTPAFDAQTVRFCMYKDPDDC